MTTTTTMTGQMALSEGVTENASVNQILLEQIPGALQVHRAATANDKNGTDWWVECECGKHLSVDAKVRTEDFAKTRNKDDLALETWSVIPVESRTGKVGWTRDGAKRTDYILWLWTDTGRWCLVPFPMLCKVFQDKWLDWRATFKTATQNTNERGKQWQSECVFVPRRDVWAEIYRRFSGQPN